MLMHRFSTAIIAFGFAALTLMCSSQAQAHAHLKTQYPAANATITAAPQALTLTFSEGIEPGFSALTLTGPDNIAIPTGAIKIDPANPLQIIVPIEKTLTAGVYQVQWHVVSVDSHKTQGSYQFSVK